MRAIELFKELESVYFDDRTFKTLFGNHLAFIRDDSIKAYVFKKGEPMTIGILKTVLKDDFVKDKVFEDYHIVGKLVNGFSSIKDVRNVYGSDMQVSTYAEADEQEPFDLTGDTTGIVDISWYGFCSSEVYRHSFSTACCNDFLGDSIDKKKRLCACCGRKIDYSNVIKKELHETA